MISNPSLMAHESESEYDKLVSGLMAAHNRIDSDLALRLKCSNLRSRFAKLTRKPLGFEFSFGVLAGRPITLSRETFRLLR